jgi:hypothetical protein
MAARERARRATNNPPRSKRPRVGVTAPVKGPAMERVDRAPRAPDLSVLLAGLVAGEGTSESRRTAPRA